jgi:hypothetical protein
MNITAEEKKELDRLEILSKDVRHKYISGKIKTYNDVLRSVGYTEEHINKTFFPSERSRKVKLSDVNEYLSDLRISLSTSIWLKHNPPDTHDNSNNGSNTSDPNKSEEEKSGEYKKYIQAKVTKAKLYWHQTKAAFEAEQKINEGKRGILLVGDAGVGKTIILGEIIAKLQERNYTQGSVSPWPYIYITKANIVEQTKRDLEIFFGLKHPSNIFVTNIDSLRSKAGELWVDENLYVEGGEEHYEWKWRPFVNPVVLIWDECQSLKNSTSEQHKIACALNDFVLEHLKENHHQVSKLLQIFASATPFTRVSEAKCFAVSTRVNTTYGAIV